MARIERRRRRRPGKRGQKECLFCKHIPRLMMIVVAMMVVLLLISNKLLQLNTEKKQGLLTPFEIRISTMQQFPATRTC